jgi:putative SOS response-associated peptidase YedK
MCGRYVSPAAAAIEREFNIRGRDWRFPPSFNVAPTQQVPAIREGTAGLEGVLLRWGLVPFFAKAKIGPYSTINARVESVETSASYRTPWKRAQRCLLPAQGFYEWHVNEDGTKQPYYIHLNDQAIFGFAGLWDHSAAADGTVIESCTIITLPANPLMARVHNGRARMPAILAPEQRQTWLVGTADVARGLLQAYPQELMVAFAVGKQVNSPRNNDARLIEPLPPGEVISAIP